MKPSGTLGPRMQVTILQPVDSASIRQAAEQAGEVLTAGGLVVFPTETVYGIAACASSERGLSALRAFKDRPDDQPFTVHLPDAASVERYVDLKNPLIRRLVHKTMPGPVTLMFQVTPQTMASKLAALREQGALGPVTPEQEQKLSLRLYNSERTIGLRCPDHALAREILGSVAVPVVAASANRTGMEPPKDAEAAIAAVGQAADLVIDGGPCRYARASTVVRVIEHANGSLDFGIDRSGVLDERYFRKLLRYTLLMVCSGNTCRSPMAEGIARQVLSRKRGVPEADLEAAGYRVISAGAFAAPGQPVSSEAVDVLREAGIDISGHRSSMLTRDMIHEADLILCMTESHRRAVLDLVPAAADRTMLLDPRGAIEDPIGAGLDTYRRCADQIRSGLHRRLDQQQL